MNNDIAWAAGLLEGEGSFYLRNDATAKIQCGMTDLDVLEKLQGIFGGKIYKQKIVNDKWKQVWVWNLEGPKAFSAMLEIRPFLLKRRASKVDEIIKGCLDHKERQSQKIAKRQENCKNAAYEYINNGGSLRDIAKRYSISYVTVKNYADKIKSP